MELVLSPGRLGGDNNTGSPFQNQEVREWSHVDRLTGMLEHARIETGRWQTRHQGTAQAYGKVIDSRERNSADGNVVQKARRQVEVFQSQGIGGRSVQVVRASQWSSSRITDSTSTSPVSVSMNDVAQLRNGSEELTAVAKSVNGRLCADESLAKLSQVSRLCRQINGETTSSGITRRTNLQTNGKTIPTQSPLMSNRFKKFDGASVGKEEKYNRLTSSSLITNNLKSTSNEDLTNSTKSNAKSHTTFARDCKARRSLQIPKSVASDFGGNRNNEMRSDPEGIEFVERSNSSRNSPSSDHDVSKNDRKIVKSYVLGMEEADSEVISSSLNLPKVISGKKIFFNGAVVDEIGKDESMKSEYLRPTPILMKPKPNTTVVHLNNKLFLDSQKNGSTEHEQTSSIVVDKARTVIENDVNIRTIAATSRVHSLASRFSNGNNNFKSINGKGESVVSQNSFAIKKQSNVDSSSRIESLISRSGVINGGENGLDVLIHPSLVDKKAVDEPSVGNPQNKPVKKVGFCKTEVHFAAESGKVNIVETDAKPPPSNRFRRRRRNSVGLSVPGIGQNKNLPLIHFGDTSYEKYIFGQAVNGAFKNDNFGGKSKPESEDTENGDLPVREKTEQRLTTASDESIVRDGWRARLKTIMQSEPPIITDENDDLNNLGKNFDDPVDETTIVDHSFKGSHTTTVNLGANVISKIQQHTNEGKCDTISTGIQLQFNTRLQKLTANSSATLDRDSTHVAKEQPAESFINNVTKAKAPCSVVVSTTTTTTTTTASKIPRPLIQTQQSILKSAHLVMNLNRINNFNSIVKTTGNNDNSHLNNRGDNEDSFTLKQFFYSLKDNYGGVVIRGKESDVDIVNNNHPVPGKKMSTLITVSANNASLSYKNLINNGSVYPVRFTPLRLKHFNDRLTSRSEERKKTEDSKDNQLQYSSGSEQADEEVRSYMLGSNIQQSYNRHKKYSHSRTVATDENARNVSKPVEQPLRSSAANHTLDIDHSIDNTEQNHMADDDELENIVDSGLLPVEEICFEANRTVEKNHLTEKLMNDSNVLTLDNENNKVLLNIVTTHEPVIARVEDHSIETRLFVSKKLRGHISANEKEEADKTQRELTHRNNNNKSFSSSVIKKTTSVKDNAKDHCDNKSEKDQVTIGMNDDTNTATDPTYVNVFENVKKSVPIYENYRVTRKNHANDKKNLRNGVQRESHATQKSGNGNCNTETNLPITDCGDENFTGYSKTRESEAKVTTISEGNSSKRNNREAHKVKPSKSRSKKISRPPSSASSIESIHRNSANESANKDSDARPLHTKSTRSSRLHRVTSAQEASAKERYSSNEKKKNTTERTSAAKVSRSNHTGDKDIPIIKTEQGLKSVNDNTRSKKPIEIVYQTAVFNMKNEKLAKSSRSKESKTPRYINDLICGSKPKRSTDARHVKGTTPSQQRVCHKSASPTNRHWK